LLAELAQDGRLAPEVRLLAALVFALYRAVSLVNACTRINRSRWAMKAELVRPPRAPRLPKAPAHLRLATRRFWNEVVRSWDLETHHLRLLALACEALDRCQEARERIALDGAFLEGRYGVRAHPAIAVERDSRLAAARLLRELDLDASAGAESRPPLLRRYD